MQTCIAVALVLAWGAGTGFGFGDAFDVAYVRIYTMMAVQGVVWILAIQAVCALAVIVWHRRHKHPDSAWVVVRLPRHRGRSARCSRIYLLFKNIDTLAGTIGYVDLIAPDRGPGGGRQRRLRDGAQAPQPREVRHDRAHDRRGGHAVAA